MKLYADSPTRCLRQIVGDLLVLAWMAVWVGIGLRVQEVVLRLAVPGEKLDAAGTSLAERLVEASHEVDDLPLVGDAVARPFRDAGSAAEQVAAAGRAQVEAVETMALWSAVAVVAVPVLMALIVYVPIRLRFIRRATAARRALQGNADPALFALRALANQPLRAINRISADPVAAWRAGDPEVIRDLAALELKRAGLDPERLRS